MTSRDSKFLEDMWLLLQDKTMTPEITEIKDSVAKAKGNVKRYSFYLRLLVRIIVQLLVFL